IARSVLPTIERTGGTLVVGAAVDHVLLDGARAIGVRMTDGRELRANAVVSDAGMRTTVRLVPKWPLSGNDDLPTQVGSITPTPGHLCLYVALRCQEGSARLEPANLWIHPTPD